MVDPQYVWPHLEETNADKLEAFKAWVDRLILAQFAAAALQAPLMIGELLPWTLPVAPCEQGLTQGEPFAPALCLTPSPIPEERFLKLAKYRS